VSGLRPMQRVSYLSTLLGWFDAWRSLGYILAPIVVLATGVVPIRASLAIFLPVFLAAFLVQRYALRRLTRGLAAQGPALVFDLVRMPANLQATLRLFSSGERPFSVTAKGKMGEHRTRMPIPPLLIVLVVVSLIAATWGACTLAGLTPLHYATAWAIYGSLLWLTVNTGLLITAGLRIRAERFGAERRAVVRFDMDAPGWVGGSAVRIVDVSLTGARYRVDGVAPDRGDPVVMALELNSREAPVVLRGMVRDRRIVVAGRSTIVSVEFDPGQSHERAAIALTLFANGTHYDIGAAAEEVPTAA
jgi:cellulose synthase (UDP-forming)